MCDEIHNNVKARAILTLMLHPSAEANSRRLFWYPAKFYTSSGFDFVLVSIYPITVIFRFSGQNIYQLGCQRENIFSILCLQTVTWDISGAIQDFPKRGMPMYYFGHLFKKYWMKLRKIGRRRACVPSFLGSANGHKSFKIYNWKLWTFSISTAI